MEEYALPDGRLPIRFTKRRAAYYERSDGKGEVRYTFSAIKYMREKRPNLPPDVKSEIARKRRDLLLKRDPEFYQRIGSEGGKRGKNANSKDSKNTQS